MEKRAGNIGCILMASGLSVRYGRNKLLEKLDGREVILHTAESLIEAGFTPLTVTRSAEVKTLLDREGIPCVLHDKPRKSDTIHIGIEIRIRMQPVFYSCPGISRLSGLIPCEE